MRPGYTKQINKLSAAWLWSVHDRGARPDDQNAPAGQTPMGPSFPSCDNDEGGGGGGTCPGTRLSSFRVNDGVRDRDLGDGFEHKRRRNQPMARSKEVVFKARPFLDEEIACSVCIGARSHSTGSSASLMRTGIMTALGSSSNGRLGSRSSGPTTRQPSSGKSERTRALTHGAGAPAAFPDIDVAPRPQTRDAETQNPETINTETQVHVLCSIDAPNLLLFVFPKQTPTERHQLYTRELKQQTLSLVPFGFHSRCFCFF
jgi:hypothetical protein